VVAGGTSRASVPAAAPRQPAACESSDHARRATRGNSGACDPPPGRLVFQAGGAGSAWNAGRARGVVLRTRSGVRGRFRTETSFGSETRRPPV